MKNLCVSLRKAVMSLCGVAASLALSSAAIGQTKFDFSYAISDSRINVFDDGNSTRLQLPEGLVLPAVISRTPAGEQILTPRRDGMYLVVDGVHAQLALVWANNRQVQIQYMGPLMDARQGRAAAHAAMQPVQSAMAQAAPVQAPTASPAERQQSIASAVQAASQTSAPELEQQRAVSAPAATAVDQASAAVESAPAKPAPTFSVRQRETIRETLARWSQDAGWTHLPEHYTVDFDVQILGSVEPYTDFRSGVRALLGTTSMTERPLQPCFYSNQVLRVVLRTQRCDQI